MADETMVIDAIDRRIIEELRWNARCSWRELSARVHLAPSSVADRVRKLEDRGLIKGYVAVVNPAAFGRTVRAVIDVGLPPGVDPAPFEALLATRDEVALAVYVTGQSDYTMIVDCAGAEGLDGFIRWLKAEAGVARTESRFVLRPIID
ncbi:MAG: Lrp/AsnC family transcriptional regulator [Actinomycetota bacterium]|jgi:Lrp/AsnC family leucine-responsive transcriptional regulator|nr:MAG: putative AsnC family transcriptional regulator [Acidimicrobiaceae bacterium]